MFSNCYNQNQTYGSGCQNYYPEMFSNYQDGQNYAYGDYQTTGIGSNAGYGSSSCGDSNFCLGEMNYCGKSQSCCGGSKSCCHGCGGGSCSGSAGCSGSCGGSSCGRPNNCQKQRQCCFCICRCFRMNNHKSNCCC